MSITFTLDLEDHRVDQSSPGRYEPVVRRLLSYLAEKGCRSTVFVVGSLARRSPALISEIFHAGHEIAYHSRDHVTLDRDNSSSFMAETGADKAYLEDLTGQAVTGFRAPVFSLTADTMWAVDCLTALGFTYSSSVLPAAHPLFGFPGAPNQPFRWPSGLIELPVPMHRVLGKNLPYLGGVYLRYLPSGIALRWAGAKPSAQVLWTYCHPYDFDATEPFCRIKGANFLTSIILWLNREDTLAKIEKILSGAGGAPLCEKVAELEQNSRLVDFP